MLDMAKWQHDEDYRRGYLHGWYDRAVDDAANYERYLRCRPGEVSSAESLGSDLGAAAGGFDGREAV